MTIQNPTAPATAKQLNWIKALREQLSISASDVSMLNKGEASALIDQLLEMKKNPAPAATPASASLTAMAAALEGKTFEDPGNAAEAALAAFETGQVPAAPAKGTLALSTAEAKTLLSWYPVLAAEVDPTEDDQALEMKLQLFLGL